MVLEVPITSSQRSSEKADERNRGTFRTNHFLDIGAAEWQLWRRWWSVQSEPFASSESSADLPLIRLAADNEGSAFRIRVHTHRPSRAGEQIASLQTLPSFSAPRRRHQPAAQSDLEGIFPHASVWHN